MRYNQYLIELPMPESELQIYINYEHRWQIVRSYNRNALVRNVHDDGDSNNFTTLKYSYKNIYLLETMENLNNSTMFTYNTVLLKAVRST
jgi:hypothetical protein